MMGLRISGAVLLATLSLLTARAETGDVIDYSIHQQYVSPRALGMGNAFVGLADDYNALFYNPAGLARLEEAEINLGISGGFDSKFPKFYNDIKGVSGSKSTQDMVNLLTNNNGNYYSMRATVGGIWARPKWAFAIIPVDVEMKLSIHQLQGESIDLVGNQDTTIAYGRGWDVHWFKQDRMSLGFTTKAIYRAHYNTSIGAGDLAINPNLLRSQNVQEGFSADTDFGMLYSMKVSDGSFMRFLRPSIGFTVRNVFDYGFPTNMHFIDKQSAGSPPKLGRRYDLGTAWELPDFWIFKTRAMADLRDVSAPNYTVSKGLHFGAEFLWKVTSWWQGGWRMGTNQGYFTAGFTGLFGMLQLDLVTYAEEMGTSNNPIPSRRYVVKASLDW